MDQIFFVVNSGGDDCEIGPVGAFSDLDEAISWILKEFDDNLHGAEWTLDERIKSLNPGCLYEQDLTFEGRDDYFTITTCQIGKAQEYI